MVKGQLVDVQTRCIHWQSALDIIAIKFKCCNTYYACYECHREIAGHQAEVWPKNEWHEKAIICGVCKTELSIHEYFESGNSCPHCQGAFNPNCSKHYYLYFEI